MTDHPPGLNPGHGTPLLTRRGTALALAALVLSRGRAIANPATASWTPLEGDLDVAVTVHATIGRGVHLALVDTGASRSVIDRKLATQLGLQSSGGVGVQSDAGATVLETGGPLRIAIGGHQVELERVILADLSLLAQTTSGSPAVIVGQDVIGSSPVEFDLPGGRMRFVDSVDRLAGSQVRELPMSRDDLGRFGAPVRLEGAPPALAVFDLGSSNPLMLSEAYARANGLLRERLVSSAATGTVAGTEVGPAFTVRTMTLGGVELRSIPVLALQAWEAAAFPVNVGLPVLRRFRIAISWSDKRLRLLADSASVLTAFARDRSGLGLTLEGDRLLVRHVAEGSPAAVGGWREGDEIVDVDGVRVTNAYFNEPVSRWRFREAGVVVRLTLSTGEVRTLRLRDYY